MTIPYFQVLAFTERMLGGNPAGVCILKDSWLPAETMQMIATENNVAETAFLLPGDGWEVRWFSPKLEIALCGHATLASAHVLFSRQNVAGARIDFRSQSGPLRVERGDDHLVLDFPSLPLEKSEAPADLIAALGTKPVEVWKGRDYFAILPSEQEVAAVTPDFDILMRLEAQGVVVTAPGKTADFVSRYFAPKAGIPEDSVTGSTHCNLIPFWSKRLGKQKLKARQLSNRGGELICENRGDRVGIGGKALIYIEGQLHC